VAGVKSDGEPLPPHRSSPWGVANRTGQQAHKTERGAAVGVAVHAGRAPRLGQLPR